MDSVWLSNNTFFDVQHHIATAALVVYQAQCDGKEIREDIYVILNQPVPAVIILTSDEVNDITAMT